jgi:hypothetical protein
MLNDEAIRRCVMLDSDRRPGEVRRRLLAVKLLAAIKHIR